MTTCRKFPALILAIPITAMLAIACGHSPEIIHSRHEPRSASIDNHLAEGVSLYRSGHLDRAEGHLATALTHDPSNWTAHYYLGLVLAATDDLATASVELHQALELAPNDGRTRSRIYFALGQINEQLGHDGKARLAYLTALNLWPNSHSARTAMRRLDDQLLRTDK